MTTPVFQAELMAIKKGLEYLNENDIQTVIKNRLNVGSTINCRQRDQTHKRHKETIKNLNKNITLGMGKSPRRRNL